jgi:succinate dehydrogenase / fumarate reductase membrane anchor subunit
MAEFPAGISHRRRISGVSHWRWQRFSAVAVLALMSYFTILLATMGGLDYDSATALIAKPYNAIALAILLVVGLYHAALGIEVVIEDYVSLQRGRRMFIMLVKFDLFVIGLISLWALAKIAL